MISNIVAWFASGVKYALKIIADLHKYVRSDCITFSDSGGGGGNTAVMREETARRHINGPINSGAGSACRMEGRTKSTQLTQKKPMRIL